MRVVKLALPVVLSAALLAAAGSGVTASAKTVKYKNIVSPNEKISCLAVKGRSTEIECFASFLPEIGELDTYLALRKRGRSRLSERGDFPGYDSRPRTLHNGNTWKRPGIRCTMRKTGLTCRNRDDHGFHLERGNVRRF